MNISILLPGAGVYGGVRRFCNFADALIDRGHKVDIYTPEGKSPWWLSCKALFIKQDCFLKQDHDVTISAYPSIEEFKLSTKAIANKKVFYLCGIYDPISMAKGKKPKNNWIAKLNEATEMFLTSPEFIKVANATWLTDFVKENIGVDIQTLIGGIDRKIFNPFKVKKINNSVIYTGEQRRFKASNYIVNSFDKIRSYVPKVYFNTYKGRGLKQKQMAEFICSHTVFADDQVLAGWHNPVIEAMACGMPVACFDIPGVKDFAFHGENCLLAPLGSKNVLAKSIATLLMDKKLADKLSANALKTADQFTWEKTVTEFERIIN